MISRLLYRYVFKRTSSFVLAVVIASMFFERAYDEACEDVFEWINQGRLWSHIKHLHQKPLSEMAHKRKKGNDVSVSSDSVTDVSK